MRMARFARLFMWLAIVFALNALTLPAVYADDGAALRAADADSGTSVSAYLTVSDDGEFVTGNDGTVLANVPITVDYFDLGEYGLGKYAYEKAGERPTLLHLFIRATERFYLCRGMDADDFDEREKALWATSTPGSLYLKYFWGHDENLLYHVNDEYPQGSPGWGLTCDRIVLEDGDVVDLAMFTNWGISNTSAFAYFGNRQLVAQTGEDVLLEGLSTCGMMSSADVFASAMRNAALRVSRDGGCSWSKGAATTDAQGKAVLRFDEPGTYLVSAGPAFPEYEDAMGVAYRCVAPPIAVVSVADEALPPLVASFDAGGGSDVPSQNVTRYDRCARPDDPVRPGYTFEGWYEDPDLTREYDFGQAVTSSFTLYAKWERAKKDISLAKVSADRQVYSGHALTPEPTVSLAGKALARGVDYEVSYENNVNAGQATIAVRGIGGYEGVAVGAFAIARAPGALVVKAKAASKKRALVAKASKKKGFAASRYVAVSRATGDVAYARAGVKGKNAKATKAAKKKASVNARTGKVAVKKGLPRGTYTLTVAVTSRASANYGPASKHVTVRIRVK